MMAHARRPRTLRQGSVRRRRSHPPHAGAHHHRICLAFAVRASASDPPDGRTAARASIPNSRSSICPASKPIPRSHGCATQTVIAVNFTKKLILIGGTSYAGEMKKSVFTIMNYLLPAKRVMSMHCSANVGKDGKVGDLLRSLRHRQDHAFGRCDAHADRRRRAWLERARRLQYRRRLLRQGNQAFARKPNRRSSRPRNASARCWKTW